MVAMEEDADRFARDFLIPPSEWSEFRNVGTSHSKLCEGSFAWSIIAPFVVVGRLQKEELISYKQLSSFKRRYEWVVDSHN